MGDMLFNLREDPGETTDIAADHPAIVEELRARLDEMAAQRPPLGDKGLIMDPPLPYVYGTLENEHPPAWLKEHVDRVGAKQPKHGATGETPWPEAPQGGQGSPSPRQRARIRKNANKIPSFSQDDNA